MTSSASLGVAELESLIATEKKELELWQKMWQRQSGSLKEDWCAWQNEGLKILEGLQTGITQAKEDEMALCEVLRCHDVVEAEVEEWMKITPKDAELENLLFKSITLEKEVEDLKKANVELCTDAKIKAEQTKAIEDMYGEYHGLAIHRPGGSTQFVLTEIDPYDSQRQFIFDLKVYGGNFRVLRCSPMINGLKELVDTVNAEKDRCGLSMLVFRMRQKFKEFVVPGNAAHI